MRIWPELRSREIQEALRPPDGRFFVAGTHSFFIHIATSGCQRLFADRQRPLKEGLGLRVLALVIVEPWIN